jgi:hypothetical protein
MLWTLEDLQTLADRIWACWTTRQRAHVEVHCGDAGYALSASTDGRSISSQDECLLTRANDGFLVILNGKRYGVWRSVQWMIYALAELTAAIGTDSAIVQPPEFHWRPIEPDDLTRWWRAELEWTRGGENARAERYVSTALAMLDAWRAGESWYFYDGYRDVDVAGRAVRVHGEAILAKASDGVAVLSGRRYRRSSERFRFREALRIVLDETGTPYRVASPKPRGRVALASELSAAGDATMLALRY